MCRNFYKRDIYYFEFIGDSKVMVLDLADNIIGEPLPITVQQKEAALPIASDVTTNPFNGNIGIQVMGDELEELAKILDIGLV